MADALGLCPMHPLSFSCLVITLLFLQISINIKKYRKEYGDFKFIEELIPIFIASLVVLSLLSFLYFKKRQKV